MHAILTTLLLVAPAAEPIPAAPASRPIALGGVDIQVHTCRPADAEPKLLVLVFHGTLRNASEYRDWAKPLVEKAHAVVAAPEFDAKRFSSADYNRGGLLDAKGGLRPKEKWTFTRVRELADVLRKDLGKPDLPYACIGHSAGGQFVDRLAAFADTGASRLVASNPSSWLLPTRDMAYGYGFGKLPDALAGDDVMRRYLAAPLVLYLGTADTATTKEQDEYLDISAEAKRQGASRFERGHNAFQKAHQLAKDRGWPCNWKLVEASGVGHVGAEMLKHPRCLEALGVTEPAK
jgi:pimeloyl-ACP methyl ester carboxylesterase